MRRQGTCTAAALLLATILAESPASAETPQEQVVQGNNVFATDIYKQLAPRDGRNLLISPLSIHTAMTMTFLGARGATAREMAEALHLEMDEDRLLEGSDALLGQFDLYRVGMEPAADSGAVAEPPTDRSVVARPAPKSGEVVCRTAPTSQLRMANALWAERRYPFEVTYLERVQRHFRARLETMDFRSRPEAARDVINRWVETETGDRIKDLLPPGLIDDTTRLILTNAIYFKGNWVHVFPEGATKDRPFYLLGGGTVQAPQMQQTGGFDYAEDDGLQLLSLPYTMPGVDMVVLLPNTSDGLSDLEKRLTAGRLAGWLADLEHRVVEVTLPRWTFESDFKLKDVLQAIGIKLAFTWPGADFTGMSSTGELYIADVIHKAFVAVDEKGTEAAAATAVHVRAGGTTMKPAKPVVFTADHPFMFLIRHRTSGAILFLGRVTNPEADPAR